MSEQPVQLRLGFTPPTRPQRIELQLAGMTVVANPDGGDMMTTASYLSSVGVQASMESSRGLLFPVRELPLLLDLPHRVDLVVTGPLRVLYELVQNPPDTGIPVMVTMDGPEDLNLSWPSNGREFNEPLPSVYAPALASLGIPVLADNGTWQDLAGVVQLPLVLARARVNIDGFVELVAASPGKLEMAPLPALFKIDGTRFGVPLKYADVVAATQGVTWEGMVPTYDQTWNRNRPFPIELSTHAVEDLDALTSSLARSRGRVVAWSSGLGRRVFCASAVTRLDAFPLVLVCRPGSLWVWKRVWELLGVRASVSPDSTAPVRLVTYQDAASLAAVDSPAGILLDDVDEVLAVAPHLLRQMHRLDGVADIYRLACCKRLPTNPDLVIDLMSLVRPVEFKAGVPAVVRYPGDAARRLAEHVECYTSVRTMALGPVRRWTRSTAVNLEMPEDMEPDECTSTDAQARLEHLRLFASRGSEARMGPKISLALEQFRSAKAAGERLAILTLFEKTAVLLRSLLVGQAATAEVFVGVDAWPGAKGFDRVLVLDYPDDLSALENAVDPADSQSGQVVTLAHLVGSIDDRLALAASLVQAGEILQEHLAAFVLRGDSAPTGLSARDG